MRWSSAFIVLSSAVVCGEAANLRLVSQHASLQTSLESNEDLSSFWASVYNAEAEDRSFLIAQLDKTENELVQLQHAADSIGQKSSVMAGLQISAAPVKANATTEQKKDVKAAVAPAAKAAKAATVDTKKQVAKAAEKKETDPAKLMASLGIPSLKLKGKAALAPMLAMLKGLYQDSKDRIQQQNAREEKSKKWFTGKEAEHKAKLEKIEGNFKNGTLSEEFRTNETRDENRYFNYWSRCRERQHRQFHTNLKIQHAMMMKTKKMIEMYEKSLSGDKKQEDQAKKQLAASTGMPEIVFLQDVQRTVGGFVQESLAEVRKEKDELREATNEGSEY